MPTRYIHLISDSTGQTAEVVANACIAQFKDLDLKFQKVLWPMVRTLEELHKVLGMVEQNKGIIIFTLSNFELRKEVRSTAARLGVPAISPLGEVVLNMYKYYELSPPSNAPGTHLELNDEYFRKIEAMQFTQSHDDGQHLQTISAADIILIGVSRSSKTPTSMYLANRGFRVANIPYFHKLQFPVDIEKLKGKLIIGLTLNPANLHEIRKSRMSEVIPIGVMRGVTEVNDYADLTAIHEEVRQSMQFFARHNIPTIDVTNKAVEETASEIIRLHTAMHFAP